MKTIVNKLAVGTFIALLFVAGNINAEAAGNNAIYSEDMETALQVEPWMMSEIALNTTSFNYSEFVPETETALAIEGWMLNNEFISFEYGIVEEPEAALEIESWMINDISRNTICTENEPALKIESWMMK